MFHILIGIILVLVGLAWMAIAWWAGVWGTESGSGDGLGSPLWGLIPIALGILAIWRW